jgi:hypothetical protein
MLKRTCIVLALLLVLCGCGDAKKGKLSKDQPAVIFGKEGSTVSVIPRYNQRNPRKLSGDDEPPISLPVGNKMKIVSDDGEPNDPEREVIAQVDHGEYFMLHVRVRRSALRPR